MNASMLRERAANKPLRTIVLPPAAFADTWEDKPADDVAVGLRLLSERDLQAAKAEASRWVERLYARDDGTLRDPVTAVEAWNDALIRWACALAMCDVNDVRQPYFRTAEDVIGSALTPDAIRRVWDALELMGREESPVAREASDDDLAALGWRLVPLEELVEQTLETARAMGADAAPEDVACALRAARGARPLLTSLPERDQRRVLRLLARVQDLTEPSP